MKMFLYPRGVKVILVHRPHKGLKVVITIIIMIIITATTTTSDFFLCFILVVFS